jgi:hypothetical protein
VETDLMSYIKEMENEIKQLKMDLLRMSWYMRGGLDYHSSLQLSPVEREIISDLIKDNLETTKKTGKPFF